LLTLLTLLTLLVVAVGGYHADVPHGPEEHQCGTVIFCISARLCLAFDVRPADCSNHFAFILYIIIKTHIAGSNHRIVIQVAAIKEVALDAKEFGVRGVFRGQVTQS
jgi:hypothetical protein